MKLTFNEHIFSSVRNGTVTILSLESPKVFQLQGPLANCWRMAESGQDFPTIAAALGIPVSSLEEFSSILSSNGFLTSTNGPALPPAEAGPWSWEGLGTLSVEVLVEELGVAYGQDDANKV